MASYNLRNPAVKRILQEVKELQKEGSREYAAKALEDNLFEWHFVVRGPSGTDFEGGIYHGRILLPPEYPMKPPSFMMLTPNGRFQTSAKICLSISSHHPEHWQPSWSVRTALVALTAFMPTPGNGAIGSLDFSQEERRKLAAESRAYVPAFGSAERQALSAEMHAAMLAMEEEGQQGSGGSGGAGDVAVDGSAAEAVHVGMEGAVPPVAASAEEAGKEAAAGQEAVVLPEAVDAVAASPSPPPSPLPPQPPVQVAPLAALSAQDSSAAAAAMQEQQVTAPSVAPRGPAAVPAQPPAAAAPRSPAEAPRRPVSTVTPAPMSYADGGVPPEALSVEDKGLTWLAGALSVAIAALLLRKIMVLFDVSMDELLPL
mmetsp:Transcript_11877/g.30457  ORF Transcript_11877/g.30457 Transcript_11877/m.30457 type:complete len:372 (-) Transcript_11877:121-1236(-)